MNWHEVTAVFGGTFDPPHLGHRIAVEGLFSHPAVARVLVVPTPAPPHKSFQASTDQRVEMVRITFAGLKDVSVDLRELERAVAQPGRPAYTYDTLMDLRRIVPRLAFVIGTDQLEKLPTWHRFPEVLGLSHWIVLERKGSRPTDSNLAAWEASGILKKCGDRQWSTLTQTRLQLCRTDAPDLSSTQIREAIARTGQPPPESLVPEVVSYLKLHRIYGTSNAE